MYTVIIYRAHALIYITDMHFGFIMNILFKPARLDSPHPRSHLCLFSSRAPRPLGHPPSHSTHHPFFKARVKSSC